MAEQSYITVDRGLRGVVGEPRLIIVASAFSGGSDEILIQDLHDSLNSNTLPAGDADDSLDNMDDEFLIASAGKEDLGGGTKVGITSTLNNAQVAFEGNYTPDQTGTATTADPLGFVLTDTAAMFITNGVKRGHWLINFDDESVTEVLVVYSETQLQHRMLKAGVDNDWEVGDRYALFEVIQKDISGGNLVAVDDSDEFPAGNVISPVFPTFATQVVRTASSSATISEQRIAAFGGAVSINTTTGEAGTVFPIGTQTRPVNNVFDARTIADANNLKAYRLNGTIVLTTPHEGWAIEGHDGADTVVFVGASVAGSYFRKVTLTGVQVGTLTAQECGIVDLSGFNGVYGTCGILGTVTLAPLAVAICPACFTVLTPVNTTTIIDFTGATAAVLNLRGYSGELDIRGMFPSTTASIEIVGQLAMGATNVGGVASIRGVARPFVDMTAGTVIDVSGLVPQGNADVILNAPMPANPVPGSVSATLRQTQQGIVVAASTVAAGSTAAQINTGLTQADGFYNDHEVLVISSAGTVSRTVESFTSAGGVIVPDSPFPYVPSVNDVVLILASRSLCIGSAGGGCLGNGSILVDENYGGAGRLCYFLDGLPVDNADITIYLAADYLVGNRTTDYLQAASRTNVNGGWQQAVMLDPETYVLVYYKQQVAGPDVFQLTVTEDPADSTLVRLTPDPSQMQQELVEDNGPGPATATATPASCPPVEGLDAFGGTGTITVDENYAGTGSLCYVAAGQFVSGAEILFFPAADWNAGNRQNRFAVAASRTNADGTWQQPVKINPGDYVVQFFKPGVAGPDAYSLTASDPPTTSVSLVYSPPPPAPAPVPAPAPDPVEESCEDLDDFGGTGTVLVDQDYGGTNALCYGVGGQPVVGAEILFFPAADYNAGRRQNRFSVAASRTGVGGAWVRAGKLAPGDYFIQFFKPGVAGPDAYPITVA